MVTRNCNIKEIFQDKELIKKIKEKLPKLFRVAELESSRAGKIGMEVGVLREKILIALIIYKFSKENVDTDIPTTEPEIDVLLSKKPISIKTIIGNGGVKAVWTVDAESAKNFINNYKPRCDILFAQIFWETDKGGFYLIPLEVQKEVFSKMGRKNYLKMPKAGTNPRGVEFSKESIQLMLSHPNTSRIDIKWRKPIIKFDAYKKWVDYWASK